MPVQLKSWKFMAKKPDKKAAAPANANDPVERAVLGLKVVAEGKDPTVDIIAIHGLNGHREKTWTASNNVNWLRDLLPHDIPNARVMCWGYDANTHSSSHVSCQYLFSHAQQLVGDLCRKRELTNSLNRPIIFVAHSLGGIVLKSALIHADAARKDALEHHRSIKVSTYGIIFMGTPHQGGNGVAFGKLMINIASIFVPADDHLLKHLEHDSEWLQHQLSQYNPISKDFVTKFAFEEYPTPTLMGHSLMIVPRSSAVVPGVADAEPICIHTDHKNMVKFISRADGDYEIVSENLQIMAQRAEAIINRRWEIEGRVNAARCNVEETFSVNLSLSEMPRSHKLVARQNELSSIHQALTPRTSRQIVILHGMGGIGKTQLMAAYPLQHKADYTAIFWLNSKDEDSLKNSFRRVANQIRKEHSSATGLAEIKEDSDLDKVVNAVQRWLAQPNNTKWLLLYDNYDDPTAFDIKSYLPESDHGSILITTRSSQVKIGQQIKIEKLKNVSDGLLILSHTSLRQTVTMMEDPEAMKIAQRLDGLPLALATAGTYLAEVSISYAKYLQLYEESWCRLQQNAPSLDSYDRTLYSTWQLSYDYIMRQNPLSAKLLQLWAYFDNQDVWFELLRDGLHFSSDIEWFNQLLEDELTFTEAARILTSHGLIEVDEMSREIGTESHGYSMHSCIHSWTINVVNKVRDQQVMRLAIKTIGFHIPYDYAPRYWITQRRIMQHVANCWNLIINVKIDESEIPDALYHFGRLYSAQDKPDEAEQMLIRARKGCEEARGLKHEYIFKILDKLGLVYEQQNRPAMAERVYLRSVQGYEHVEGPERLQIFQSAGHLGALYINQGLLEQAEEVLLWALKGCDSISGVENPWALDIFNNLGTIYFAKGKLEKAEEMLQVTLQGLEEISDPENLSLSNTVHILGCVYLAQKKFEKAEQMFQRALYNYDKTVGLEHRLALPAIRNLGLVYKAQGKREEAEKMFQQALQGWAKIGYRETRTTAIHIPPSTST